MAVFFRFANPPLLDALTVYGTQLFWPFTDLRVGINSVFIVDPFYTLPFLITVIWCWRLPKQSPKRRKINRIGLIMSCAYLCFGLVCKQYANYRFEQAFANQNLHVSRYLTDATPFNCLMWYGIGETKDGYYMGYYSFFDDGPHIDLDFVSRNDSLLTPAMQNAYVVNRIKWFSRNYYTIRKQNNELFMYNLIFGRMNIVGRGNDNNYVFGFKISENAQEQVSMQQVETYDPNLTLGKALHLLWERFKGNRNPE
ncbi:MAG: metal-dependent hydrolase [Sphingobacteriales bacterium]|nr:metal-dependent hydrolase [Sphingobacteriales bacterium]